MSRLYWTDQTPSSGWAVSRADDGSTWEAQQIGGPGILSAATLPNLALKLAGEDAALQRRYTETDVRRALPAEVDAGAVVGKLRENK